MQRNHKYILITYLVMQFSGLVAIPALLGVGLYESQFTATVHWTIFSFSAALMLTLFLLRGDKPKENRTSLPLAIIFGIGGFLLALVAQGMTTFLQTLFFQVTEASANTEALLDIAYQAPAFIFVIAVLGPILEEIVFRYILFDVFAKRFNFFVGALFSSIIFAIVHVDFTHLLVYIVMGFVFSFLYAQSKRIIVPIIAHVLMNSFVVFIQLYVVPAIGDYFH